MTWNAPHVILFKMLIQSLFSILFLFAGAFEADFTADVDVMGLGWEVEVAGFSLRLVSQHKCKRYFFSSAYLIMICLVLLGVVNSLNSWLGKLTAIINKVLILDSLSIGGNAFLVDIENFSAI